MNKAKMLSGGMVVTVVGLSFHAMANQPDKTSEANGMLRLGATIVSATGSSTASSVIAWSAPASVEKNYVNVMAKYQSEKNLVAFIDENGGFQGFI